MRYGKITQTAWQRSVRKQLHTKRPEVTGEPTPFGNCSVIQSGDSGFGWTDTCVSGNNPGTVYYAILRAAGDLAARQTEPVGVSIRMLFPYGAREEDLKCASAAAEEACAAFGLQITNLQGEVVPGKKRMTVFVSAAGIAHKKMAADKKDTGREREILMCGYAGLEGTLRILDEAEGELAKRFVPAFLAGTKDLKQQLVRPDQIRRVFDEVLREGGPAPVIRQTGDGGILAALWEMTETLHTGFEISLPAVQIRQETVEICEFYRLNPYQMTSAGSFLIVTENAGHVIEVLEKAGARAGRLGVIKAQNARVITSGDEIRYLDRPAADALVCWEEENEKKTAEEPVSGNEFIGRHET